MPACLRITHWINVAAFSLLLMSGLQIFNAHPALYVGNRSDFDIQSCRSRHTCRSVASSEKRVILGHSFDTTACSAPLARTGRFAARLPELDHYPELSGSRDWRRWHFFFAWLLVLTSSISPGAAQAGISAGISSQPRGSWPYRARGLEHLRLRFPRGAAARRYNVLQQLAYLLVVFVLLPLMILTGLTMSPGIDSAVPQLLTLVGGRQSARLIHFVAASGRALFVIVHLVMVLVRAFGTNLRSMVTGWYDLGNPRTTDVR